MQDWRQLMQEAAVAMQATPFPDGQAMRRALQEKYGAIRRARHLEKCDIDGLAGGRALVGVDGSVNRYGATFPYLVYFYRALAASTWGRQWLLYDFFCPVRPGDREQVEEICHGGLQVEEALSRLYWKHLAAAEARAALAAARDGNPFLLLLDGGFSRLQTHAPGQWEELQAACCRQHSLLVGVVEEVSSNLVGSAVGLASDRPVFFGLLAPGEYLVVPAERPEWLRVYGRLSQHPQAVAVEMLAAQEEHLGKVMDFLYTTTPAGSRGIPLWLDIVDRRVRLTSRELQVILRQAWEPAIIQKFIYPQRERRVL